MTEGEEESVALKPHQGHGLWRHAAFHVATTIATPAAYAPLPFAMASLTWPAGVIMLVMGTLVTWYNSLLVASLWEWDGVRHVRYRDLGRSIFGKSGYYSIMFFQQLASLGNNITIQIAAGISMKAIYKAYYPDNATLTLQQFIIFFGILQLILSQFPDIHSLRWVNAFCTLCTIGFTASAIGLSVHNGRELDRSTVVYDIQGTSATKVFSVFSALGTIAFSFGDAMLPEIQSTLKEPGVKRRMYKGVSAAYLVIMCTYWTVAWVGYWAFGSTYIKPYLLDSMIQPRWAIVMANLSAMLQIVGCYQIYCRPTYGLFDTKLMMKPRTERCSIRNCLVWFVITAFYISFVTLVASALPFFGDFVSLCGAIGFTPLDFIIPPLAYLKVWRPKKLYLWITNCGLVLLYTFVAIVGSIGALRFIGLNLSTYNFFSNMY